MNSWSQVIIEWANCLGIVESSVESIQDLQDGVFYETLVTQLCRGNEDNNFTPESDKEFISTFLQAEYPQFECIDSIELGHKDVYLATLLLIQCAQQPAFHRPMCVALNQATQVRIKRFLEVVLPHGKDLTKESIEVAIKETEDDVEPSQTQLTPKVRPLREFFNSPAVKSARSQRFMNERNRELMCLRAQLETEQYEKADLIEDLKIQSEKVCNLQKKLEEKTRELRDLRIDRLKPPTPQSCRKSKKSPNNNDDRYRRQAMELEVNNSELALEMEKLRGEREELARRLTSSEKFSESVKEKYEQSEKTVESLTHELETRHNEILYLRMNNEELREHIRQTKRLSVGDQSFDVEPPACDEALSSIVDLQLQEARKETSQLKNELSAVSLKLENSLRECEKLRELEILFRDKATEVDSLQKSLHHTEEQLSSSNTRVSNLELEGSQLSEKLSKLENSLQEKTDLLILGEKRNNELESNLDLLHSKVNDLTISLKSAKSENIELNSIVESTQRELENVRSMLSCKEEKLLLLTKEKNDFESLLKETKEELRQINISLDNEKVSVKKLGSIVKSCNEQSQALQKDLSFSNERLVLVNEEKNNLESTLRSVAEKLEATESCLENERTRGAELESNLEKANGDIEHMKNLLDAREESLNKERIKVTEFEAIADRVKTKYEDLQATLDDVKVALKTERDGSNALKDMVERSKKNVEDLESLLQSKEELLRESNERENHLKKELESFELKINELNDSLRMEIAKSCELETRLSQKNEKYVELEAILVSNKNLLEQTEVSKREVEMQLSTANVTMKEIESELVNVRTELSRVEEQNRQSILANDTLEEYNKAAAEKMTEMETKICNNEILIEHLNRSLTERTEKINELQNESNEKSTLADSLARKLDEARKQETVTADLLRANEQRIAELQELGQEMESQLAQELEKSSNLRGQIKLLEDKLSISVRTNNDLGDKLNSLKEEFNETQEKLQNEIAVNEELKNRMEELCTVKNELEENLVTKEKEVATVLSQWDDCKEELASYVIEVSDLKQDLKRMTKELEESQENFRKESMKNADLRKESDASRAMIEELNKELATKKNEVITVVSQWDECKKELASYVTEISVMKQDIEKLAAELKESQENFDKESLKNQETKKEFDASRAMNKELEEKLATKQNEFTTLLGQWGECKKELASHVTKLSVMEEDIEQMTKRLRESQENFQNESLKNEEAKKELDSSHAMIKELEEKLTTKANDVKNIERQWEESKEELASYVTEISVMKQDIEKMAEELKESQENFKKESLKNQETKKELDASRAMNEELQEKLATKQNEFTTVLGQWDECKKELASHVTKFSVMEQDIEQMTEKLKESEENFHNESLKNEEAKKELDSSHAMIKELEEKLATKANDVKNIERRWEECKEELASRVTEILVMKQDIGRMTAELEKSHEKFQKESLKNEGLRKELAASCTINKELEEKWTKCKIDIETLRTDRNNLKDELARYADERLMKEKQIEKMKQELEKYDSDMQQQIVANSMLTKKELESNELIKSLQAQLTEDREHLKNLESAKTCLEQELSSFALFKADKTDEINELHKVVEKSRTDQQNLQEKHNEECDKLQQQIKEINKKSKLHVEEIQSLRNQLETIELEKARMTEKIQETNNNVVALEKRLVIAENMRMEIELEDKLKKEALNVVQAKLEHLSKEKVETELKMKEVIVNLQEVRTSQDQVMEAQIRALEEKSRQHDNLEKELDELRIVLNEKSSKLETEESRVRDVLLEVKKLEEQSEEKSALVKKLESSLELEHRKVSEMEQNLESLSEKMVKIGQVSQALKVELNTLWDSVRDTCPELARPKHVLVAEDNAENLLTAFVEDTKAVQKVVSILSEANETLKEHVNFEKESAKTIGEEVKKQKSELDDRLKSVEMELEKRDKQISLLAQRNKDLRVLLVNLTSERDKVDDELVHLINRWKLLNIEAENFVTTAILDCEELKQLVSQRNAIESSLFSFNERHICHSKSLLKALHQIFCSSETELEASLPTVKAVSSEIVLSEEIQRSEEMKQDLASLVDNMNEFSESLKTYDTKLRSGLLKDASENEKKLRSELEKISKEKKEIRDKLDTMRARNAKMEKNMDDLRNDSKKVKSDLIGELEKLRASIEKLEEEKAELSKRIHEKADVETLHNEYGQKLEKIKQKMKTAYNEQIAKLNQEQEKILKEKIDSLKIQTEQQCRKYAEDIAKYKAHISDLSSRYWDVGEKLLAETQEKQVALQEVQRLKELKYHQDVSPELREQAIHSRQKTASLDRREFTIDRSARDPTVRAGYGAVEVIEEETTTYSTHRRHSVKSIQAMGNAFRAEDEEGEVFDSVYLADLKEGRCAPTGPDLDRLSELRMRNSMCRPHLKSSYAVETHLQPIALHEDDIKNGVTGDDVFNDSLSQSLLPGQKPKKKDRTQTSYKRPGPPTPSKNGGRLSLQGNELKSPSSRILKERNVERRTTATPRGLKNLFGTSMSKRQDENTVGTPKGRRLSNIFRKQRTERN